MKSNLNSRHCLFSKQHSFRITHCRRHRYSLCRDRDQTPHAVSEILSKHRSEVAPTFSNRGMVCNSDWQLGSSCALRKIPTATKCQFRIRGSLQFLDLLNSRLVAPSILSGARLLPSAIGIFSLVPRVTFVKSEENDRTKARASWTSIQEKLLHQCSPIPRARLRRSDRKREFPVL